MALIILGLISILLCYKWGDWRNWITYYPTILFYIVADFTHVIMTTKKELWLIYGFGNDVLADFFISLIIAPCIVLLFLPNYPKKLIKQILYTLLYVVVLSIIEFIAHEQNSILYFNGWNFGWTVAVYIEAFILLRLHHSKPLWAWFVFLISTGIVMFYFKISPLELT